MVDIHRYGERLQQSLSKIDRSNLSGKNKEALLNFYRRCVADGIGAGKLHRYLDDLLRFGLEVNKDFIDWNRKDIESIVIKLAKMILNWRNATRQNTQITISK